MPRRILILILLVFLIVSPAFAGFLYQTAVKDKTQISRMKDDELLDTYIDVLVEVEASNTFHQTSGFRPQDYESYKKLIKYRILLEQEINKRGLRAPGSSSGPAPALKAEPVAEEK